VTRPGSTLRFFCGPSPCPLCDATPDGTACTPPTHPLRAQPTDENGRRRRRRWRHYKVSDIGGNAANVMATTSHVGSRRLDGGGLVSGYDLGFAGLSAALPTFGLDYSSSHGCLVHLPKNCAAR